MTFSNVLIAVAAVLGVVVVVFLWERVHAAYYKMKLRRLLPHRTGYDLDQFKAYFGSEAIPDDICKVVYNSLPDFCFCGIRDFPVKPDDDLEELYRIGRMGGLTIDLALVEMGKKLNISLPEERIVAEIWREINWTGKAKDVVRYFHVLRKKNAEVQMVNAS